MAALCAGLLVPPLAVAAVAIGAPVAAALAFAAAAGIAGARFLARWLPAAIDEAAASFCSPFVPEVYGLLASLWLLALMASGPGLTPRGTSALAALALALGWVFEGHPRVDEPAVLILAFIIQLLAYAVIAAVLIRAGTSANGGANVCSEGTPGVQESRWLS